ncbi:Ig-like domain-containing protein [Exiguobacterium indicum]|uniref:Ig-like domain-containing protein n=1 Tax=Exiguobacterium indicum TaxID=296995 RepID=A0ABU8EJ87_9BACL
MNGIRMIGRASVLSLLLMIWSGGPVKADGPLVWDQPVSGVLKANEAEKYDLTVTRPSKLTVDVSGFGENTRVTLQDERGKQVLYQSVTSDGVRPAQAVLSEYVEPGNYRLVVAEYILSKRPAAYTLRATADTITTDDQEPNNGTLEAQVLPFQQAVRGMLSAQDEKDIYQVNAPKNGKLSLAIDTYLRGNATISLTDSLNENVFSSYLVSEEKSPGKFRRAVYVEAGTYFLTLSRTSTQTGRYQVQTALQPVTTNEQEPNDGVLEATRLLFAQSYSGLLTWQDHHDYYRVTLPKKSRVTFDVTTMIDPSMTIEWTDSMNKSLYYRSLSGSEKTPGRWKDSLELPKGTYYFRIGSSYYSGYYRFRMTASHLFPVLQINPVKAGARQVSGTTEKNATVRVTINQRTYTQIANQTGRYTFSIPVAQRGTKITISSENRYGKITKQIYVTR